MEMLVRSEETSANLRFTDITSAFSHESHVCVLCVCASVFTDITSGFSHETRLVIELVSACVRECFGMLEHCVEQY